MDDVYTNTKKAIDEMTKTQRSSFDNVRNLSKDILEPSRYVTAIRRNEE